MREATGNNLKKATLELPVGLFVCVTGVSGSGKSTLVNDTMYAAVARHLYGSQAEPAPHDSISGLEHFDKVVSVDQSPIGRTPRSNPATYTGLFTPIRDLFAGVPEARVRGYDAGRFSFNVKGGRCEACQGDGVTKVEMHFLADIYVACDVCHGKRYNRETLEIRYKGRSIHEVLQMTVAEAVDFFSAVPAIRKKLRDAAPKSASPTSSSASRRPRSRAARRSASSCRWNSPSATPAARSTSWMSRPRACTSTTSSCCSTCCIACGMPATRSWSSSTTWMSSRPPTGSSTSAPKAATAAGASSPPARPKQVAASAGKPYRRTEVALAATPTGA